MNVATAIALGAIALFQQSKGDMVGFYGWMNMALILMAAHDLRSLILASKNKC